MNRTKRLRIVGGDHEAFADRVDRWQSSARAVFNKVVEEEARTAKSETKFDAFKRLTDWRKSGIISEAPLVLQRGTVLQSLMSCRLHREAEAKLHARLMLDLRMEGMDAEWIHSLPDGLFPPDGKKECRKWLDALPEGIKPSREVRSAVLHTSKRNPPAPRSDRSRMRRRRDYESGRHRPALFFVDGLKRIDAHHMRLPGKVVVRVKGTIPESFTSAQVVERTPRPQGFKGSGPCPNSKRRFSLHVQFKKANSRPKPLRGALGVDLGVVNTVGTSEGNLFRFTDNEAYFEAIVEYQKRATGRRKGGVAWRRELKRQRRIWRGIKGLRVNESRHLALHLAESADLLVLEELEVANMRRSAAGSPSDPGRNVKAKQKLNDRLGRATLGMLRRDIASAVEKCGTSLVEVPSQGTSQTCFMCGHRDRGNREIQSLFRCMKCRHEQHADVNASQVIADRGLKLIEAGRDPTGGRDGRPPREVIDLLRETLKERASSARPAEVGGGPIGPLPNRTWPERKARGPPPWSGRRGEKDQLHENGVVHISPKGSASGGCQRTWGRRPVRARITEDHIENGNPGSRLSGSKGIEE